MLQKNPPGFLLIYSFTDLDL